MAGGASGATTVLAQAARSIVLVEGGWPRLCQPSTLRMVIWPEASNAQNSMAAVSAEGSTVWVLILRLNSSCSRSMAFVVRALFHWLGGRRVKANRWSPASEAVGNGPVPQPPFAQEGLPALLNVFGRRGVDHVGVVGRDLIVEPLRRMG